MSRAVKGDGLVDSRAASLITTLRGETESPPSPEHLVAELLWVARPATMRNLTRPLLNDLLVECEEVVVAEADDAEVVAACRVVVPAAREFIRVRQLQSSTFRKQQAATAAALADARLETSATIGEVAPASGEEAWS